MYVICTYDVDQKRCAKVMKLLRKYMFHEQNSVFEGELTPSKMKELKEKLSLITTETDKIIFYYVYQNKSLQKEYLGKPITKRNIII